MGIIRPGMLEDEELDLGQEFIVIIDEVKIDGNGLLDGGILEAIGYTDAI